MTISAFCSNARARKTRLRSPCDIATRFANHLMKPARHPLEQRGQPEIEADIRRLLIVRLGMRIRAAKQQVETE